MSTFVNPPRRPRSYRAHRRPMRRMGVGFLVLLVLLIIGFVVVSYVGSERDVTFQLTSKERVCDRGSDGNQECRYLVFTDQGTFQLTDTIIFRRFDSSDLYGRLQTGVTYDARVAGWRIPLFSRYPNVLEAEPR